MRITWCAHAAFLIESNGLRIITDPYTPASIGFASITEPADIVIRSSSDDRGHCNAEMITGNPFVVTATEIDPQGITVRGLTITSIAAQESLIHKEAPLDNAIYRFTLEGIQIAHLGDVGNRLTDDQLAALAGTEVLIAPTGGPPTIDLDDLYTAITVIQPRIIIPMHYDIAGTTFKMLPVTAFTERFPTSSVQWVGSPTIELTRATLPAVQRVVVLEPSTAGVKGKG